MSNTERKRYEAEKRVRNFIKNVPPEYIEDFYIELNKNLKNGGSNKTVDQLLQEMES